MSYAIGLMSGTSLDGVDVALVDIHGSSEGTTLRLLRFLTVPFPTKLKVKLQTLLAEEVTSLPFICSLNFELGYFFADCVKRLCQKEAISQQDLSFIASHGQTIFHLPEGAKEFLPSTLQLGESSLIAELTQTTVISDFRYRDMAVGGQGAPIVPYSEFILYQSNNRTRILQNIGGIGNATILPKNGSINDVVAFDTGPGNMIIDELCRIFYQQEYDENGNFARQGTVNQEVVNKLLQHPYFSKAVPKTTGREDFGQTFTKQLVECYPLSANDWIATATQFTASSIAQSLSPYITEKTELIIGGGGSYNKELMNMLKEALPNIQVLRQEDFGWSSDAKEAIAMTVLGNQTLQQLPSNVPNATGAAKPVVLGKVTYY